MPGDELVLRWRPANGPPQRYRFRERSLDGLVERVHEEWTGCVWKRVGRDAVADVTIELDDGNELVFEGSA